MAFEQCIAEIVKAGDGKVDENEAKRILLGAFDRASRYEKDGLSRSEAMLRTARELGDEERVAAAIKKRSLLINIQRRRALNARVTEPGTEGRAVKSALSGVEGNARDLANSVDAQGRANELMLTHGMVGDLREAGLLDVVKRRDKTFERDIGREMYRLDDPAAGAPTGNKFAEQVAKILHRWQETARRMENKAGAYIRKLEHYVTRQSHDREKIMGDGTEAAYRTWRDYIEPRLDERTFEGVENRDGFLKNIWSALSSGVHDTSNGADWLSGFKGSANLAKKLSEERVLHFKDADAWLDYNEKFGQGNIVDSVVRSLQHGGHNAALMNVFGTNPQAMFDDWIETMIRRARDRGDFKTVAELQGNEKGFFKSLKFKNQTIFDTLTGKSAIPQNMTLANIGRGIRIGEAMAKLGSVVISSISDIGAAVGTLRWNGVPLLEAYGRSFLAPLLGRSGGGAETRHVADLLAVGADTMITRLMSHFSAEDRFGTASKMVETFHRLNLLSYWTDSLKTSIGTMLSYNLARNAESDFAALPRRLQVTLRRYGIEGPEWEAIRRSEQTAADGRKYILPGEMANLPDEAVAHLAPAGKPADLDRARSTLQTKLGAYITDQTREGMTEPTARSTTAGTLGTQPGTLNGEAMRLMLQFKTFPITFLQRSVAREFKRDGVDVMGVAHLIAATTLLGYVSMTAKELLKGRDPRKIESPGDAGKIALAAMQQGGGLGIYGDFLFGEANRMGGGFIGSLVGPAAGTLEDVHRLFTSMRDGSNTKSRLQIAGAEGLQIVKNNAPFVNLFYTRMALDYFIIHRLQEAINPGYLRRYEQRVKKENNQTFWLSPSASPYH